MDYASRLSNRLKAIKPSATVALNEKAAQMIREGKNVIAMAAGEPDFDPPSAVLKATRDGLKNHMTHYTSSLGIPELRKAICEKLQGDNGLTYNAATDVLVTPGAKQGIVYAALAFLNDGDEVIAPEPAWVSYPEITALAGAKYVPVATSPERNFEITREALEAAVTPRSRMIFINSPCNPTGRVLTMKELEAIAAVAKAHDLFVLSDEIYEKLVFDKHVHRSIATLPGMWERTMTLNGFSKAYAMTGYRLGYVAAPAGIIRELNKLQQHSATCPTAFAQSGAAVPPASVGPAVKKMVNKFKARRKLMAKWLSGIPGLKAAPPEGTFYMWLDCRGITQDSRSLSHRLLEEALVALTPGVAFGACGEGFLRLSFAMDEKTLEEACNRVRAALGGSRAS